MVDSVNTTNNASSETRPAAICVDDNEKSRTFRKRRLTCVKHHLEGSPNASSFRDRRLTQTHSRKNEEASFVDGQDDSTSLDDASSSPEHKKLKSTNLLLRSRVLHAAQLHPVSPNKAKSHRLYQPPFQVEAPQQEQDRASLPTWRHRHTHHNSQDDETLPFPRDMVGTYSCHGVEPVYDSEYEEVDEDDDDDEWTPSGGKELLLKQQQEKEEETATPTTVAKINQDRGGVVYPYANSNRTALFAVYDGTFLFGYRSCRFTQSDPCSNAYSTCAYDLGHGQGGELVSQYALHQVQKRLETHPSFEKDIERAFKEIFVQVDADLKKEPLIDPLYAGTTACVVLLRNSTLCISNVGDSRAVLARRSNHGEELQAIDLSKDQNPNVPDEQKRIESMGGFVSQPLQEGLSARVWLDDTYSQIGLAMARSIGDHAVAPVGVIAEPEVTFCEIQKQNDFLILATDGVWEFITSQEAIQIVNQHLKKGATKACQALIEAAADKWHDEEGNYRDDITALVVRLQDLWDSSNSAK